MIVVAGEHMCSGSTTIMKTMPVHQDQTRVLITCEPLAAHVG
jgi:hypothetical protein